MIDVNVGDIVKLASGGPEMTVNFKFDKWPKVSCSWFDSSNVILNDKKELVYGSHQEKEFAIAALELVRSRGQSQANKSRSAQNFEKDF